MLLGVHVSGAGKLYEALDAAAELGCNTMQVFSRSPQQWRRGFIEPEDAAEFNRRQEKLKIRPFFVHIPYLINLASPDRKLYESSIKAYVEDIAEAESIHADYIVTHMGSHKDTSEEAGLKRLTDALNRIIEATQKSSVGILLENTSGSGSWLGYKFIHQKQVLDGLKDKERIGLCLDTAHAYLAGYDLSTKEGLEAMVKEIDELVGTERIKLVHLNDARGKLGSKHDRHDHIGKGGIGTEGIKRIINHPKLRALPFILETPKETQRSDKLNLARVRKLKQK